MTSVSRMASETVLAAAVLLMAALSAAADEGPLTVFDLVELDGIARALEAKTLRDQARPAPTKEFEEVIQSHPDRLVTPDRGKTWQIRPSDQGEFRTLSTPALKPDDLACAVSLLRIPVVKKYVRCLKEASRGQGTGDCLSDLVKLAATLGDGKDVLLASLQARVFTLASRNPAWRELAFGRNRPDYMAELAAAYARVESNKLLAAQRFSPSWDPSGSGITFQKAGLQSKEGHLTFLWPDFDKPTLSRTSFKTNGSKTKVLAWRIAENGKVINVNLDKEFSVAHLFTCEVAPDHQIIVSGKLSGDTVQSLRGQDNVQDILKVTGGSGASVFLSRPGSASVGVLSKEK